MVKNPVVIVLALVLLRGFLNFCQPTAQSHLHAYYHTFCQLWNESLDDWCMAHDVADCALVGTITKYTILGSDSMFPGLLHAINDGVTNGTHLIHEEEGSLCQKTWTQ